MKTSMICTAGVKRVVTNSHNGGVTIYHDPEEMTQTKLLSRLDSLERNLSVLSTSKASGKKKETALKELTSKTPRKNPFVKFLWNLTGSFLVAVGFLGIFLPILPTLPLILLAGFCYFRGSSRFYNWLTRFGALGKLIQNYRSGRGLTARTKLRAILLMWFSLGISIVFFISSLTFRIVLFLVGIGVTVHILRIKTDESPKALIPEPRLALPEQT